MSQVTLCLCMIMQASGVPIGVKNTQLAIDIAQVADAWRKGLASADSASSILNILFCLETPEDQLAKQVSSGIIKLPQPDLALSLCILDP